MQARPLKFSLGDFQCPGRMSSSVSIPMLKQAGLMLSLSGPRQIW